MTEADQGSVIPERKKGLGENTVFDSTNVRFAEPRGEVAEMPVGENQLRDHSPDTQSSSHVGFPLQPVGSVQRRAVLHAIESRRNHRVASGLLKHPTRLGMVR